MSPKIPPDYSLRESPGCEQVGRIQAEPRRFPGLKGLSRESLERPRWLQFSGEGIGKKPAAQRESSGDPRHSTPQHKHVRKLPTSGKRFTQED